MKRAVSAAALAAIALVFLWSAAAGAASLAAWWAGELAERAPPGPTAAGSQEDRRIRRLLTFARTFDPANASHDQRLGEQLERASLAEPAGSAARRALLEQAETLYRSAAAKRPTWPLSLTPLMRVWLKLGRVGPELGLAYRRAVEIGLHEPAAQRALADLALVAWPVLDPLARDAARELLGEALRTQSRYVLERAAATGRTEPIRPLIAESPELKHLLRRLEERYDAGRGGGS